jgi:hypothetical protein
MVFDIVEASKPVKNRSRAFQYIPVISLNYSKMGP